MTSSPTPPRPVDDTARQARIRAVVDQAPPLTERQLQRLRVIVDGHRTARAASAQATG